MNELLNRVQQGTALPEDYRALRELIDADTTGEVIAFVHDFHSRQAAAQPYDKDNWDEVVRGILQVDKQEHEEIATPKVRHLWKKMAAAALIVMMLGAGGFWWLVRDRKTEVAATDNKKPVNDVAPGGNKAILTLADNSTIILDSAANGQLAQQGNTTVIKSGEGQLAYSPSTGGGRGEALYNTLATPRGGQYQLVLPDGSKVWLNAASSIRYPTAFTGNERSVDITGEAYFEVTKNPKKRFIVNFSSPTGGGREGAREGVVEVLGTHFNINAYDDEPAVNTTLLEGAVKVRSETGTILLKPGEQASTFQSSQTSHPVSVQTVVAWKNGLFSMEGADIKSVMRQMARWYDVDVVYEANVNTKFFVEISRNTTASNVFKMLEATGRVHFRIEGKKVIVTK